MYCLEIRISAPANYHEHLISSLLRQIKKKWLNSVIYGSWRDQINYNLNSYFKNYSNTVINRELILCKYLPKVEMRMAIFNYFEMEPEKFDLYVDSLRWGLQDSHPWVRREAIKVFVKKGINNVYDALNDRFCNKHYPGILDLLLVASTMISKEKLYSYIKSYDFTENEVIALKKYVD